jgi:AraC-like DNA-binding protein
VEKENICHFASYKNENYSIHMVNMVYETERASFDEEAKKASYAMHLVVSGEGFLKNKAGVFPIKKGDIFFTFPGVSYTVSGNESLSYMYISYLGIKANMIMDKLGISLENSLFSGYENIIDIWFSGLQIAKDSVNEWITESLLLYAFSHIGNRVLSMKRDAFVNSLVGKIKRYIDENYFDTELSLDSISKNNLYSAKYISRQFKKELKIGVCEYIQTVRIQNAISMFRSGFRSVSDVSMKCGFSDSQYFSKIFKKKMNLTPREYISKL